MGKLYKLISLMAFMLVFQTSFAQLGSACGVPQWYGPKDYPQGSYVFNNGTVYKSTAWSGQTAPVSPDGSTQTTWTALGNCDEALLRSHPDLIYTNCAKASDWDKNKTNYNTGDLVRYKNGAYQCLWWTAGKEVPDQSLGYKFLGVCVPPIDVNPTYVDKQVVIQPTLTSMNLSATLNSHGFSISATTVEIKKTSDANYVSNNMSVSGSDASYNWTPPAYGDYNIRYTSTNSVGVSTVVNTTIKIAISNPPSASITNPANNAKYYQLNFAPIGINFLAKAASGNTISKIYFKDNTANTSNVVAANAQGTYTYQWTPTKYGINALEVVAEDNLGTTQNAMISLNIINPSIENVSFGALPNQLKSVMGVTKKFTFDQQITSVLVRDPGLFSYTIAGNELTITPNRPGRSGIAIKTTNSSGTTNTSYVGLRVDNANGTVPKYPEWVSVGSVSEDTDDDVNFYNNGFDNTNLLKNNRMDVRYIYINGGPTGGWSSWQPDRVIKFARNSVKMGLTPFFVFYNIPDGGESYTTDLEHMRDPVYMKAYFENLHMFLDQVKQQVDDEFFGVILEPDFLGYMQQNNEPTTSPSSVGPNSIGKNAGTLQTLVNRINSELESRRIKDNLNMEFGWQLNLWAKEGVAGIRGIIRETDGGDFQTQLAKIKQTARDIFTYSNNLGIMSHNADFISIDKYGLDAMGSANASTPTNPATYTWFWNNDHWMNYLDFVKSLNEIAGKPVILWQIPVGHINGSQTKNEYTNAPFVTLNNTSKRYEDSASSFFFGDEIDFSNDNVRYNYFTENKHNDPKLIADATTKKVKWGNHFKETKSSGTNLILMGAGVGDSTDGIGKEGVTLTDDHFWIQKLQDYYLNHLVSAQITISGLTVTGSGTPISNATVLLVDDKDKTIATTTSDGQGKYTFTNVTSGYPYTLKGNKTNYVFTDVKLNNVTTDLKDKNIVGTFQPTANVSGTTVDNSGSPIPGVNVSLVNNGGTVVGTTISDPAGKYAFNNIATGVSYTLKGSKANYTFTSVDLGTVYMDASDKNIVGKQVVTVNISGITVSSSGTAINSANVTLVDDAGKIISVATSDASGNFAFNNIAAGVSYTLKGNKTGYTFADVNLGTVNQDVTGKNVVGNPILINISGTAKSNTGTTIDGVTVTLVDDTGKTINTTTSDAQGKFTFSATLGSKYTLKGSKTNYTFTDVSLGIVNHDVSGKDITGTPVAPGMVSISGATVNSAGAAISGTTVDLVNSAGATVASTTSNASGDYSFTNVTSGGSYTLKGTKAGYSFANVNLGTVSSNQTGRNLVGTIHTVTISGTAKSNTGTAIDGVVLTLVDNTGKTVGTTASDAAGKYSFSNITPGGSYTLKGSKTNYTFADVALGTVNSDATGKDIIGTLVSARVVSISGATIDGSGAAITGTTVSLLDNTGKIMSTTNADAAGKYTFTNVTAGGNYALKGSKTGYSFNDVNLGTVNSDLVNMDITGAPVTASNVSISGATVNNTGAVIGGTTVSLVDNTGTIIGTTTSDASGNYAFTNVTSGGTYTLKGSKTGFSFADVALGTVNTNLTGKNIVGTANTIKISGTAKTNAGAILDGVVITLVDNAGNTVGTTASDASGKYNFSNITPGGSYTLKGSKTGFSFADVALGTVNNDATGKDIIGTAITVKIAGTTKTNTGTAINGVAVTLVDNTGNTVATTTSDASGNYAFTNITYGGSYTLKGSKTGFSFADVALGTVNNDATGKDLIGTINTVKIAGTTITNTGTAITAVVVTLVDNAGNTVGTTASDASGKYNFSNITSGGSYTLKGNKTGFSFADVALGTVNNDATGKDLIGTVNTINISGTTKTNTGITIHNVSVSLIDNNTGNTISTTSSDASGNYTFTNIAYGGSYTLKGSKTGFSFADVALGTVNNDATGKDLIGTANGTANVSISGTAKTNAGTAINGVAITLVDNTGKTVETTTSDAAGNYSFTNIPVGGSYTLKGSKTDYVFTDVALGVVNSNVTGKDLIGTLNTNISIAGFTVNSVGTPINGATVILVDDHGKVIQTVISDGLGSYIFNNVAPGVSYRLKASKPNYSFSDAVLGLIKASVKGKILIAVEDKFSLYPNPAKDFINIVSSFKLTGKVIIYDQIGKKVKEYIKIENNQVNTSGLSEGLYILEAETDGGKKRQLIVIKN